jgi:hypothetical protein
MEVQTVLPSNARMAASGVSSIEALRCYIKKETLLSTLRLSLTVEIATHRLGLRSCQR